MLIITIHTLLPATRNPTILRRAIPISPLFFPKHFPFFHKQKPCLCYCSQNPPMSASKIVAEYAKSNRSTCKHCSEKIDKDAARIGLVSRDSRGYDLTKWLHLKCFPGDAAKPSKVEQIRGFDSLKSCDQEALRKVMSGCGKQLDELVQKVEEDEENELEGKSSKKRKLSAPDEEVVQLISFSVCDVKSKYKDATLLPKWKAFQTLIFLERDDGLQDSSKIAAFDFDGCLAKTSVKRVGADIWSLMYPSIPDKLQSLHNDGYKLVIFTNESNIERWTKKRQVAVDSKLGRLDNFLKEVKVPIQIFVACGFDKPGSHEKDPFRKPQPGMWRIMEQHFNSGISVDMDQSFYVGDAAGREGDHSDADIKFAQAIGLKFYVPEEYFEQTQ